MLAQLRATGAPVIFSSIDWHRAAAPAVLAAQFGDASEIASSISAALAKARPRAGAHGIVFVCGSLYLVGEAKLAVRERVPA
jgi:folylpolyglutamate synthase/dihydropteroate synthase